MLEPMAQPTTLREYRSSTTVKYSLNPPVFEEAQHSERIEP